METQDQLTATNRAKEEEVDEKKKQLRKMHDTQCDDLREIKELTEAVENIVSRDTLYRAQKQELETDIKRTTDDCKNLTKKINKEHKTFKNQEHLDMGIVDYNKELSNKIDGTNKLIEEQQKEHKNKKKQLEDLVEEQQLFVGKLVTKGLEDKTVQAEILKLSAERQASEDIIKKF